MVRGKKIRNTAACRSSTAPHDRNQTFLFSMFASFAVAAAASARHPHRMYGFTARDRQPKSLQALARLAQSGLGVLLMTCLDLAREEWSIMTLIIINTFLKR